MKQYYTREGECNQCGKCCKHPKIKINYRIKGDVAHFYEILGFKVKREAKWTVLTCPFKCPHLRDDNSCKLYGNDKRPLVCFLHPIKKWQLEDGCGFTIEKEDKE